MFGKGAMFGGKMGGGKGNGWNSGGDQMVTVPLAVLQSLQNNQKSNGFASNGKGGWQSNAQGGFGKGGKTDNSWARYADPSCKAWIGGFPQGHLSSKEMNQALKAHMGPGCKYAEVGKKGCGFALYANAEEVQNAVATLNGSSFQGTVMQVDFYNKGSEQQASSPVVVPAAVPNPAYQSPGGWALNGKGGGKGAQSNNSWEGGCGKGSWEDGFGKGGCGKGGKVDNSWARYADPALKVWIGGFPIGNNSNKDTNQALKAHMGEGCKYAEVGAKGTGFALYANNDQVVNAVAILNGSTFQGTVMQVDVYEKNPKQ